MICPQCGQRNELGVGRCQSCGAPFTRDAVEQQRRRARTPLRRTAAAYPSETQRRVQPRVDAPPTPVAFDDLDDTGDNPVRVPVRPVGRQSSRGRGCLLALGVLAVMLFGLALAALVVANFYVKPMVRDAAVEDLRAGVQSEVTTQIAAQVHDAPTGEVVITQAEINERIDATGSLGPIDDVDVVITPAGLEVDLSAYGLSGDYNAQVVERDGALALDGGSLGGPLSFVVPEGDLESAVNAEIAAALSRSGYRIESVVLGDGEMTLVLVR